MKKPMVRLPNLSEVTRIRSKYNMCLLKDTKRSQRPEILTLSCYGPKSPIVKLPKVICKRIFYTDDPKMSWGC